MAAAPRVRPRTAIAAMVDKETHPPRRKISTQGEVEEVEVHWTTVVALALLPVFMVALTLGGFFWGTRVGLALLGLAASALTVAYLLGSD